VFLLEDKADEKYYEDDYLEHKVNFGNSKSHRFSP
jgi:hypothetical protein